MNKSEQLKKEQLLEALEKSLGIVSTACQSIVISRTTYYKYYNDDEDFKQSVDSISDIALDCAESQLFALIKEKNVTAIIFYLKTKGKKRGYVEKLQATDQKQPEAIEIHFVDGNGNKTPFGEQIAS
jgi:hypothetical protein